MSILIFQGMNLAYKPGLHRFCVLLACSTLLLLVAGGLVTSNDAGLSVPDWPLSYGSVMPPMVGGVFYEHGHRIIASTVGFLTIIMAIGVARRDERAWMRKLGWAALAMVVVQGVLGGVTVKFLLPKPISIAHASLAQLFFCTTVALAVFTSRWWMDPATAKLPFLDQTTPRLRTLSIGLFLAVFMQLLLGASFRHKALSIVPHVAWAMVVTFLSAWMVIAIRWNFEAAGVLRRLGSLLSAFLVIQLLLGGGAYWSRLASAEFPQPLPIMVFFTVTHLAVGAATLGLVFMLLLCSFRLTQVDPQFSGVTVNALKESAS